MDKEQYNFSSVEEWIAQTRAAGLTDVYIAEQLHQQGWPSEQIHQLLAQVASGASTQGNHKKMKMRLKWILAFLIVGFCIFAWQYIFIYLLLFLPITYLVYVWLRLRKHAEYRQGNALRKNFRNAMFSFFLLPVYTYSTAVLTVLAHGEDYPKIIENIAFIGLFYGIYIIFLISLPAFLFTFLPFCHQSQTLPWFHGERWWCYAVALAYLVQIFACAFLTFAIAFGLS